MYKFRVVLSIARRVKKKSCTVEARGIVPAIEAACAKTMLFGWDIKSATALYC